MVFFSLILACTTEGGIGINNKIPWNIPEEMALFKKITTDVNFYIKKNAVIMGRKTWNSLSNKPLKNRINIIITSNIAEIETNDKSIIVCKNFDDAIDYCDKSILINKIFVIGGKSLYDLCINNLNYSKMIINIHLSIIKDEYICDTFIDLKKIIKLFKNFDRNEIIFNSNFIYIKYLNLK
jgi:dihydrofolate reductase